MNDSPPTATPLAPTPQPVTQTTFTVYAGPPLETIRSLVASQFQVRDAFLDPYGVPTIQIAAEPPREKFQTILAELRKHGLTAALRGTGDTLTIKVFQKPQLKPPRRMINLGFFLATVATVFYSGFFFWTNGFFGPTLQAQLTAIIDPTANPYLKASLFAGGLLSIVGLHEFGHKAAARYHRMDATLPYFIPGIPPIGTFGALISLKSPPANRDQLFDLGLSGPVVGFVVTIAVASLSILLGIVPSAAQITGLSNWDASCAASVGGSSCFSASDLSAWPRQPLILIIIAMVTNLARPGVLFELQLIFAAQIGALLTFLNIVPAWQLDGGHIYRAVFGPSGHRFATVIGLILLLVAGYWIFAILVLVMMSFSRRGFAGVEPLDDVSPISNSRKILYLLSLVMLVLTFAFSPL